VAQNVQQPFNAQNVQPFNAQKPSFASTQPGGITASAAASHQQGPSGNLFSSQAGTNSNGRL